MMKKIFVVGHRVIFTQLAHHVPNQNISYLNNLSDLYRLVVGPFQPAPQDFGILFAPISLRSGTNFDTFKRNLKPFIFQSHFKV
jgi:hypothetical protein